MAREIQSRIKVTGTLQAKRSLHVGGVGEDVNVDLALAVNGQGQVYIPGTSLAGALRAWMEQGFGKSLTRQLWGYQETDKTRPQHDKYHYASFVLVEDAVVTLPKKAIIEVREGVGIDRYWGVAANRFQYSRAVIPRGATFPLELTVELKSGKETAAKEALDALLLALSQGDIRLGAAKTRGMGWIELQEGYTAIEQNLRSREGILAILKGTEAFYTPNSPAAVAGIQKLTLTVYWKARGPLMVKAEQSGIAVNILPLVGAIDDNTVAFVIPGSSIKGALRSQAERIIRTVCSTGATDDNCAQPFAQHLKVPLVETLFGAASQEQNPNGAKILPGLSALSIEDCYSQHKEPVSVDKWQAITSASKPQDLQTALTEANLTTTQQAFHVAVDRWTGGAAEGFLYSNLEPFDIQWEPMRLTLDFNRISPGEQLPAIALLLLLLRDMKQGRIPLGYGVNRGMGAIAIKNEGISIEGKGLPQTLTPLQTRHLPDGNIESLGAELLNTLNEAWNNWITQHSEEE